MLQDLTVATEVVLQELRGETLNRSFDFRENEVCWRTRFETRGLRVNLNALLIEESRRISQGQDARPAEPSLRCWHTQSFGNS